MVFFKHFSQTFSCAIVASFISIGCGISDVSSYTDETIGITYFSDANFTGSGENWGIAPPCRGQTEQQLWNLRSFPEGSRNGYTSKPLADNGTRYLVRERFLYGNHDNKGQVYYLPV